MKIADILALPVGEKITGSFTFTIKTAKKKWEVDGEWFQQVLLMDKTGEILADVRLIKYNPLIARQDIIIKTAEVQQTELRNVPFKKLLIEKFLQPMITADDYQDSIDGDAEEWRMVIEGKCRHGVVCSVIRSSIDSELLEPTEVIKTIINKWVEFIMTGK